MGGGGNSSTSSSTTMKRCQSCLTILSSQQQQQQQPDDDKKHNNHPACHHDEDGDDSEGMLEPTCLFLNNNNPSVLSSSPTSVMTTTPPPERLYLPRLVNGHHHHHHYAMSAPDSLDVYLKSIPSVASRVQELFREGDNNNNNNNASTSTECCRSHRHPVVGLCLEQAAQSHKCITVLQGEVAHATPLQADLLISAEATTCHVVALRSTLLLPNSEETSVLCSMAHLDDLYETCLNTMVQKHCEYHTNRAQQQQQQPGVTQPPEEDFGFYMGDEVPQSQPLQNHHQAVATTTTTTTTQDSFLPLPNFATPPSILSPHNLNHDDEDHQHKIDMELHIVGGYLDKDGTSQQLSTQLVQCFARLAEHYQDDIRMTLSTAAMSCLNTTTTTTTTTPCPSTSSSDNTDQIMTPKSRGLALDTHTGQVYPITTALPTALEGPALELRSARLWSTNRIPSLAVIHNAANSNAQSQSQSPTVSHIVIDPFDYQPQPQLDVLLQVADPVLLQVTSTSPHCESERFCNDMRRTLSFVNTVPSCQAFAGAFAGPDDGDDAPTNSRIRMKKPLVYNRSSVDLNAWEPAAALEE